jgi:hypothetical protein
MIRNSHTEDNLAKGIIAIFSNLHFDSKINSFKTNAITTFIDTKKSIPYLNDQINHHKNYIYNRMLEFGFSELTIFNVWQSKVEDLNKELETITLEDRDYSHIRYPRNKCYINIINIKDKDFFDPYIVRYLLSEKNRDIIFFFETELWLSVVYKFSWLGIKVSGGSTNQRHIFSSIHYRMSLFLHTLFGRRVTHILTSFIPKKKKKIVNYNPYIDQTNPNENLTINQFLEINKNKELLVKFKIINKIIITSNNLAKLSDNLNAFDYLKLWFDIKEYNEKLYSVLEIITKNILLDKDIKEILNNVKEINNAIIINKDIIDLYLNDNNLHKPDEEIINIEQYTIFEILKFSKYSKKVKINYDSSFLKPYDNYSSQIDIQPHADSKDGGEEELFNNSVPLKSGDDDKTVENNNF